jgi:acyl-coenzyme A thioesterase PaaI-like protein
MSFARPPAPIPQATLDHFASQSWVAAHISDASFNPIRTSRDVTHGGKGHTLTGATWNTPETITHLLTLARHADPNTKTPAEIRRFYTFGSGMNAHPDLLHGGVIATILDSTLGNVIGLAHPEIGTFFTVKLEVNYKKPITTPGTIMVRARLVKMDGRKVFVEGWVEGSEGEIHAKGDGMWLRVKKEKI